MKNVVNSRDWWRDLRCHFGRLEEDSPLLTERAGIQAAVDFICSELALPSGAKVLDLCCGPGRYAVELAHRGFEVVGLDISEHYLGLAQSLAEREGVSLELHAGDMRELPWMSHFDAVINVGTSFGYFDGESENQRVIEAVSMALKPAGMFLLEMGNRDYYLKNFIAKDWQKLDDGGVLVLQRTFDYVRSRMKTNFERWGDGDPEQWSHSWRAFTLAELVLMLEQAGFALSNVFGDWQGSSYSVDSSRMVIASKKVSGLDG